MKINRGATRIVFIFNKFVIKIPNFTYSYRNFIRGILSNIDEGKTWKTSKFYVNSKNEKEDFSINLCPVIWYGLGGLLLIMKKADVKRHIKEVEIRGDLVNLLQKWVK